MTDVDGVFLLIMTLLVAFVVMRLSIPRDRRVGLADRRNSVPMPGILREVEEHIPTIDEYGNRRTLIRIRTLAPVQGPMGTVEIERDRRHTLPGFGHVYQVSVQEYEVFHGRMRLRVDPEASLTRWIKPDAPPSPSKHAARIAVPPSPVTAPAGGSFLRRQLFLLFSVSVVVPLAIAVWALRSSQQPGAPFSPLATAIDTARSAPMESESRGLVPTPASLRETQPTAPPAETPPIKDRNLFAPKRQARVALTVSPWGTVYVNGKRKGVSPPLKELRLAPGRYTVEIRNNRFPSYQKSIDLRSVTKANIAHNFNETAKAAAKKTEPRVTIATRRYPPLLSEQWPQ